jgi:hypothetical protein
MVRVGIGQHVDGERRQPVLAQVVAAGDVRQRGPGVSRREFLNSVGALTLAGLAGGATEASARVQDAAPKRGPKPRLPLKVQPVLTYEIPKRREATSWRNWGGIRTEKDALAEKERIGQELAKLSATAEFSLEMRPTAMVLNVEQAASVARGESSAY